MGELIKGYEYKVIEAGCAPGSGRHGLQVDVKEDISPVFPYVNALLDETRYDHQNRILIWREERQAFALRPHEIKIVQAEGDSSTNTDLSEINRHLNCIPMSAIKYNVGIEELRRRLVEPESRIDNPGPQT